MARIAEDLLLLLLDNASARPALDDSRRQRALSGAVLLDLAHTCRIRPATETDTGVPEGHLLLLRPLGPDDPAVKPALQVLARRPMSPSHAVHKLRHRVEPQLLEHLQRLGQVQRISLHTKGLRHDSGWTLTDRGRAAGIRAALMSVLFDGRPPEPSTAALIALLHTVDGLSALLSLDDRSRQWADERAGEITGGAWVHESIGQLPAVNLAVTAAAIRPALATRH